MTTRITVGGTRPYDVVIGTGLLGELPPLLDGAQRVGIIHPPTLRTSAEAVRDDLIGAGFEAHVIEVPDGEDAKTLTVAGFCFGVLAQTGFTRSDVIVGLGGGSTTDLAGWVAASWLRGVRVVHIATTLAGMVDAAVGGKTGINVDRGKNLVGAFHPPIGVLCDLATLTSLPVNDYIAGLAEVIKCGFIVDPAILDLVEQHPTEVTVAGNPFEQELIERSVQVKADVVSHDLTEQGRREILNYGHTLGHAIEKAERVQLAPRRGGIDWACLCGRTGAALGRLDDATADRHRSILTSVRLPVSYRAGAFPQLLESMKLDKKSRGNQTRFVVLDGLAKPVTINSPDPALLLAAYSEVSQ